MPADRIIYLQIDGVTSNTPSTTIIYRLVAGKVKVLLSCNKTFTSSLFFVGVGVVVALSETPNVRVHFLYDSFQKEFFKISLPYHTTYLCVGISRKR
jgi:hypothetical protein